MKNLYKESPDSNDVSVEKDWRAYWLNLVKPSEEIQNQEARRQASLVAGISMALILSMLIILPIWILANPDFIAIPYISIGIVAGLIVSYILSRSKRYKIGSYVLVGLFPLVIFAIVLTAPGPMTERMLALNFLVPAILLVSILYGIRETIIFGIICLSGLMIFLFFPDVPFAVTYSYIVYMIVMLALFIVTGSIRENFIRRLQESEHRYRSLFEQSNDAVFIIDLSGNHLEVNQRAADLLGYSREQLTQLSFRDIVVPAQIDDSQEILQSLLAGEKIQPYEREFRKKDGTIIPTEINVELVRDNNNEPIHLQSVVRDISGRRQAQQQAFALAIEQERRKLLSQFVQNASHEFRTPLASIKTNLYLLRRTNDEQKHLSYIQRSEKNIDRLTTLLEMMLSMTQLDSNIVFNFRQVDVNDLLEQILLAMESHMKTAGLSYEFHPDTTLPLLMLDKHMSDAIKHLLDNAIRFNDRGGIIRVSTWHDSERIRLAISDSGSGILEKDRPRIFERFWRFDNARSTPGFGLGLPIALRIVQEHHGTIHVESSPEEGSTFTIELPVSQNPAGN